MAGRVPPPLFPFSEKGGKMHVTMMIIIKTRRNHYIRVLYYESVSPNGCSSSVSSRGFRRHRQQAQPGASEARESLDDTITIASGGRDIHLSIKAIP